jgi:hypothetical protein
VCRFSVDLLLKSDFAKQKEQIKVANDQRNYFSSAPNYNAAGNSWLCTGFLSLYSQA